MKKQQKCFYSRLSRYVPMLSEERGEKKKTINRVSAAAELKGAKAKKALKLISDGGR